MSPDSKTSGCYLAGPRLVPHGLGLPLVRVPRTVPDYDDVFGPIRATRQAKDGKQVGDSARAARAVLQVLDSDKPPVHLVLGCDALRLAEQGQRQLADDLTAWSELSSSTDFRTEDWPCPGPQGHPQQQQQQQQEEFDGHSRLPHIPDPRRLLVNV
ncbi:hypothetical protein AB0950_36025 [Streptomyces sp. NPDC007189]|uniref:hypothetical protein n=1 Tax=Streptomyces sp. NPDC007189 TaxID=3154315 RepID=UPI00345660DA